MPDWLKFGGTIGRVRFLATLSALVLASSGATAVLSLAQGRAKSLPLIWMAIIGGIAVIVLLIWGLSAAIVKRLRDGGLPAWTLPALIGLCIVDGVVAGLTGWRAMWPDVHATPLGSLAVLAFWMALTLWPGADADGKRRLMPAGRNAPVLAGVVAMAVVAGSTLVVDPYQPDVCGAAPRDTGADCSQYGFAGRLYAAALLVRANKALDKDKPLRAMPLIERALVLRPNYVFAFNSRGLAHAALGDHGAAQADYAHALALAPGYIKARGNRAYSHLVLGEFAEADADFAAIRAADPATPGHADLIRYIDRVQAARLRR